MSYKIAVASGKGGAGKTSVSVNLMKLLKAKFDLAIQLVDCDVEEPNDLLFFDQAAALQTHEILQQVPMIYVDHCTFCKKCVRFCEFNAITVSPRVKYAEIHEGLCHSCGACVLACPAGAISEHAVPIGNVSSFDLGNGLRLLEGRIKIGSVMQALLIKELKKHVSPEVDMVIFDAPPGTSCTVVETIADVDYVVLVAEPTPFGCHDLAIMVDLVRKLKKPFGVLVNKAFLGDDKIYKYIEKENVKLLGEIPFSKSYASLYAEGVLMNRLPESIANSYCNLIDFLNKGINKNN